MLTGYSVDEVIYHNNVWQVVRGRRQSDNQPVILKILDESYASPGKVAWFRREYDITRNLDLPGVIKTYGFENHGHKWVMVTEDFGGRSLSQLNLAGKIKVTDFLTLAIAITEIIGQIHQYRVIHKDINLSNIVARPPQNGAGWQVKLIDFGISTTLSREEIAFRTPNVMLGTLEYMSPEQTGRVNRPVDYRTDFYSLGVTFYELLTGNRPFHSSVALEIVHSHIAKEPVPPHKIRLTVPVIISQIILKLLAKNAEDRYQSAVGLQADLEICLRHLDEVAELDFELGHQDVAQQFQLPQKLYGRHREITLLLAAFERVSSLSETATTQPNRAEMVLVAGYSGVGKSALVREAHRPITEKHGYFVAGKYEQYQRTIPYYALRQALNEFCQQLLAEPTATLQKWRDHIQQAVGKNGQLLIDVIPHLELIIGPQPPVAPLGPQENQNRFNALFQAFIKAISQPERPLVIFVDDLQWADKASFDLLKTIITDTDIRYLLLIGAYRVNEVTATHPLKTMIVEIEEKLARLSAISSPITTIHLDNLSRQDVNHLLSDTLASPPAEVASLADLIYDKTRGNAFFTTEFLKALYHDQLLRFDPQRRRWQWQVDQIQARNITDNVVVLMAGKIELLPPATQTVLQLAAGIGHQFNLQTLVMIADKPPGDLLSALWPAVEEGLIVPLDENYKLISAMEATNLANLSELEGEVYFKFQHDRVHQSAYSLMDEAKKQTSHLRIARLLYAKFTDPDDPTSAERLADRIFDLVNQFNKGLPLMTDEAEKITLAELNLQAARKATAALAYQSAVQYLTVGQMLLAEDSWPRHYRLSYDIHKELATAYYLTGEFAATEPLYDTLLQQVDSVGDELGVRLLQMEQYHLEGNYDRAIQVQRTALALLGLQIPEDDTELYHQARLDMAAVPQHIGDRPIMELVNDPEMADPEQRLMMQILMSMWTSAYLTSSQGLLLWSCVKMTTLSLQHGISEQAAFAYVNYGLLAGAMLNDYETGHQFGRVGIKIADYYDNPAISGKVYMVFSVTVNHWRRSLRHSLRYVEQGYQFCIEGGDWIYAGYCVLYFIADRFILGESCLELYDRAQKYLPFLQNNAPFILETYFIPACLNPVLDMLGQTKEWGSFDTATFDEATFLAANESVPNALGWFYAAKIRALYWFERYEEGVAIIDKADVVALGTPGQARIPEAYFYACLLITAVYQTVSEAEQAELSERLATYHQQLQIWADSCPANYQHNYLLVAAEKARLNDDWAAISLYDKALNSARKYGFINSQALINELYAKFWLAKEKGQYAKIHLHAALQGYRHWGAVAKVAHLEQTYPKLLDQPFLRPDATVTTTDRDTTTGSTGSLDLDSLLKASQAISSEIDLDKLLAKLLKIVIENAGAQQGSLLLLQDNELYIAAESIVDNDEVTLPAEPLNPYNHAHAFSPEMVQYVQHSQESVVLGEASLQDGPFKHTPYIRRQQPKSILCTPLVNQGEVIGVIYLENNLTTNAFTPNRVEIVRLLGTQATISIANAQAIAARAEQERLRLENEYLERLNADKDKFFSIVAHDLKGPFQPLLGNAELLAEMADELSKTDIKDISSAIYRGGNQLLDLLENLLQWSRLQMGRFEYRPEQFDLRPIVEQNVSLLTPTAAAKQITLHHQVPPRLLVYADDHMIDTIIRNLTNNALKFTSSGGQVTISATRRAKPSMNNEADRQQMVEVAVRDTGVGISEADQTKLFRINVHHSTSGTAKEKGTGLGLIMCQEMVDMNGGQIWVESVLGQGTTVKFTVPALDAPTT